MNTHDTIPGRVQGVGLGGLTEEGLVVLCSLLSDIWRRLGRSGADHHHAGPTKRAENG